MSFIQIQNIFSAPYFIIGLLIGYLAKSKPLLFAVVPALIIRGAELALETRGLRILVRGKIWPLIWQFALPAMLYCFLFSLIGALVGIGIRKILLARRPRIDAPQQSLG